MLKKLFPFLTNEDLKYNKGEEETLYNKLRNRLSFMPEQMQDMMLQAKTEKLKKAKNVSPNAFEGMEKQDNKTYFSQEEKPMSETFKRTKEQKKMPATKAPEDEGYDAGIKHQSTENDERK